MKLQLSILHTKCNWIAFLYTVELRGLTTIDMFVNIWISILDLH